ncbi:glycoside hydrolase, partial [Coniochaeta ligniaria NRRL 30616]
VPTDSVTHVNIAYAWIDPNSFTVYPSNGFGEAQIQEFLALKRGAPGLKLWITVGGWDFSNGQGASTGTQGIFSKVVGTAANRAKFITSAAAFLRQFALNGVDLDWEWPGASDLPNYAALLREMRAYFNDHQPAPTGWGISFTVPLDVSILARYDLATMVQYADWINLLAFDIESRGVTPAMTVPSSDIRSFDTVLAALTAAGVPSSRINLGLGFFGRSYSISSASCSGVSCPVTHVGVVGPCSGTPSFMSYKEIESTMSHTGLQASHDS